MSNIIPFSRPEDKDHNPVFDIPQDVLSEADKKMLSISQAKENILQNTLEKSDPDTVLASDGETLIHRRNLSDYYNLWSHFIQHEEPEFAEYMGYGRNEIESSGGIVKFIDAMDWRTVEDAAKWKTDRLRIIPCPHCNDGFGIFNLETLGLCSSCRPLYDLKKATFNFVELENDYPGTLAQQIGMFITDEETRKMYLL